jgi:hypothetical protein
MENLAVKLASAGHTMSFYVKGINEAINATMRGKRHNAKRVCSICLRKFSSTLFVHETSATAGLIWALAQSSNKAFAQITNAPEHPERVWKEGQASVDKERDLCTTSAWSNPLYTSKAFAYYKAQVQCLKQYWASSCDPMPPSPKGQTSALYATRPATAEELRQSLRDYTLMASTRK